MPQYCVNRQEQPNGDHEVHAEGCTFWPSPPNAQLLGWHSDCVPAVQAARSYFYRVNGCKFCSLLCHTS